MTNDDTPYCVGAGLSEITFLEKLLFIERVSPLSQSVEGCMARRLALYKNYLAMARLLPTSVWPVQPLATPGSYKVLSRNWYNLRPCHVLLANYLCVTVLTMLWGVTMVLSKEFRNHHMGGSL